MNSRQEEKVPTERLPPPRRIRLGRLLRGLAILICGMLIGAAGALLLARHVVREGRLHPERIPGLAARRLQRKLDLTDEQAAQVREIVAAHLRAVEGIRDKAWPLIDEQIDLLERDVTQVLTAEQAQEWHKRVEKLRGVLKPKDSATAVTPDNRAPEETR